MTLPLSVPSLLGPVSVIQTRETDRALSRADARGTFCHYDRTIRVSTKLPDIMQVQTLGHEILHVVMEDSGVAHLVNDKTQEALCDAFGVWYANAVTSGALKLG